MTRGSHSVPFNLFALAVALMIGGLAARPNARQRGNPRLRTATFLWKFSMVAAPCCLAVATVWEVVDQLA